MTNLERRAMTGKPDYVDRQKLKEAIREDAINFLSCYNGEVLNLVIAEIDEAPAAELPHIDREVWCAEWIDFRGKPRCPECKSVFPENYFDWPFCPKCGKAMTDDAWKIIKKRLEGNGDDRP